MSALRHREAHFTLEEYLVPENCGAQRHEYWAGEIYAMAGASPQHNDIVAGVLSSLVGQLRGRPGVARGADQRIYLEATELSTYPDVVVACPPHRYSERDAVALTDATVVVEVLSPSTASYDRGAKFDAYKQMPSLRHYVLIHQERADVEHRCWDEQAGTWSAETLTSRDEVVRLSGIDCTLALADIYERVEF